jgi:hypothetical protein
MNGTVRPHKDAKKKAWSKARKGVEYAEPKLTSAFLKHSLDLFNNEAKQSVCWFDK